MSTIAPMCYSCIHAWATMESCDAFPDGIPIDILGWGTDHRQPVTNDNGVVFEQDPSEVSFDQETADLVFDVLRV